MAVEYSAKGQTYKGVSRALKLVAFLFLIATLLVLARIIFLFFGQLNTIPGYQFVVDTSEILMPPFKTLGSVTTPYDGIFDIGATVLLIAIIFIEFALAATASFFNRRAIDNIVTERASQLSQPSVQVNISHDNYPSDDIETGSEVNVENNGQKVKD